MSDTAKLVELNPEKPNGLLIVSAGICPLCGKPIGKKDLGDYAGELAHRLCAVEQRLSDLCDENDRLREEIRFVRRYALPATVGTN